MSGLEPGVLSSSTASWSRFESRTAVLVRSGCGVVGGRREYDRVGETKWVWERVRVRVQV